MLWKKMNISASLVFFCLLGLALASTPGAQEKVVQKDGQNFEGVISITTAPDGIASYITVPPPEPGKPLAAGFVIQYESQASSPLNFVGQAKIVYDEDQPDRRPLSLSVKTEDGKCWIFETNIYGGRVPRGCQVVKGIEGISHQWWSGETKAFPQTHEEFVQQREESFTRLIASPQGGCSCSGGCGASSCSCSSPGGGGCSVTCKSPKDAYCSGPGSCACIPPCDAPAQALLGTGPTRLAANGKVPCRKPDPTN